MIINDLLLNGNSFTSNHDGELKRLRSKSRSNDLSNEELLFLDNLCNNSSKGESCLFLRQLRRGN